MFGLKQIAQKNRLARSKITQKHVMLAHLMLQRLFNNMIGNLQQFFRHLIKIRAWQAAMAIVHGFQQNIRNTGPGTYGRGFFNPKARIETLDGTRYRMLSPKRDARYLNQIAYPVVHWPDKLEICRLLTPVVSKREKSQQPESLRFTTMLDDEAYIFKRSRRLGKSFEIWDGMEMHCIVRRELAQKLVLDATVMIAAPSLFVLLLPWLDNQFSS